MRIPNSEECSKSELDLFSVPPTQVYNYTLNFLTIL